MALKPHKHSCIFAFLLWLLLEQLGLDVTLAMLDSSFHSIFSISPANLSLYFYLLGANTRASSIAAFEDTRDPQVSGRYQKGRGGVAYVPPPLTLHHILTLYLQLKTTRMPSQLLVRSGSVLGRFALVPEPVEPTFRLRSPRTPRILRRHLGSARLVGPLKPQRQRISPLRKASKPATKPPITMPS